MRYYQVETVIDVLKELHINLLNNNSQVQEGISKLSQETRGLIVNIDSVQGFLGASLNVFDDLKRIEDEEERDMAGMQLFSVKWEDIGLKG